MPKSPQPKKVRAKKAKAAAPRFEIVEEETNPVIESWSRFRQLLDPLVEVGRDVLGSVYSSVAKAVLEQKEELEDRRAARQAEGRRATRKPGARRTASSALLEAGTLSPSSSAKSSS
jgi:hypothetical protein